MEIKNGKTLLSREDVMSIPREKLPMIGLTDNLRAFFSTAIKIHEKGCYNHLIWLIHPEVIASQNTLFEAQSPREYLDSFRIKLWWCPYWTLEERRKIIDTIDADLVKPWYKRMYDYLAIIGQGIGADWIQTPGVDICSDKGKYLKLVDLYYDLKHPDPEEVNHWLMQQRTPDNKFKYEVYGRYIPD
jgi:hypothetical protein